jgi:hypothetical protein
MAPLRPQAHLQLDALKQAIQITTVSRVLRFTPFVVTEEIAGAR